MLFIARFTDKPDIGELWERLYPAHLKWLEEHRDAVLVPGSLRADADSPSLGGLWIIEAESRAAVEALYSTDPFWTNGLRQSVEVFHWKKAFGDRKVPISGFLMDCPLQAGSGAGDSSRSHPVPFWIRCCRTWASAGAAVSPDSGNRMRDNGPASVGSPGRLV